MVVKHHDVREIDRATVCDGDAIAECGILRVSPEPDSSLGITGSIFTRDAGILARDELLNTDARWTANYKGASSLSGKDGRRAGAVRFRRADLITHRKGEG